MLQDTRNEDVKSWTKYKQGTINFNYADAYQASITVKQEYAE